MEVVRRFIDGCVNGGDLDVIDQTWSDDLLWSSGSLGTFKGRDAFKPSFIANATSVWKDMHLEIHEFIATVDNVVLRFTNSGTNVGPFMGNPPSGKHAEWPGIGIYTVRDGRITEGWFGEDLLGMLIQLDTLSITA